MDKYDLLPRQLMYEGTIDKNDIIVPKPINQELINNIHCKNYLNDLQALKISAKQQRQSGFVHSAQLIQRELTIMEGTRMAAESALKGSISFNIAGGTHHAFFNRGEGFCLLNDQVIAANWLLNNTDIQQILIIDLDVHQGNGTAAMCNGDERIFTFSMHGKNNYPLHKEKSNTDVELENGTKDQEYLSKLKIELNAIGNMLKPDFIFYQCGVDVLETDKLGKLSLSMNGCKKRDEIVFDFSKQLNVPITCTMGGGYSREIKTIIEAHSNTFRVGLNFRT
jgi:acetoin utilization deacetylase AcuC-like enzyme